jgi:hypothetical protein
MGVHDETLCQLQHHSLRDRDNSEIRKMEGITGMELCLPKETPFRFERLPSGGICNELSWVSA